KLGQPGNCLPITKFSWAGVKPSVPISGAVRGADPMRTKQIIWNASAGWNVNGSQAGAASLVLYFGTRQALASGERYEELRRMFPKAHILGCSSGGQINNNDISDDEIIAAAIAFDHTGVRLCRQDIAGPGQSRSCGEA